MSEYFHLQTWIYISVALYAPALALSTIISIPLSVSIVMTAGLAALYVTLVGCCTGKGRCLIG